jgi:hypothetical protein
LASGQQNGIDPPRAHHTIDCGLDPEAGILRGEEVVRLGNTSRAPLSRLVFDWPADAGPPPQITVQDRVVPAGGIGDPEGRLSVLSPPDVRAVRFDLREPLGPEEQIEIRLHFAHKLPGCGDGTRSYLTWWHPRLWWGFATVDDYDVRLDIPAGYAVGTSGLLDQGTGRHHIRGARSFGVFLGRGYRVLEAAADDVQIRCLHTDAGARCAQLLLDTAVDAVGYYRDHFGFYPQRTLTIVPGEDRPLGGWPIATALVGIHGQEQMADAPELHWKWITAHEIAHMYWGEHVLEKDDPAWLWIGLGLYADREYVRARGLGEGKHRQLMDRYIAGVRQGIDTTIERPAEQLRDIDFDHNNIVIHGKGFSVISALCSLLGKDTFDSAYEHCLHEFAGRRLGRCDFQRACEEESGQDLGWFFDQWLRTDRCLSYEIASQECARTGDRYRVSVTVKRRGSLRMPVPVEATLEDGSHWTCSTDRMLAENVFVFESDSALAQVRLDPKRELANIVPPPITGSQARAAIEQLPWTGAGDSALTAYELAKEAGLGPPALWFKLGLALYDGAHYEEAAKAFESAGAAEAEPGVCGFGAAVWQGHILDILGRRDEALRFYRSALEVASGHALQHSQYGIIIDRAWVEERLKTPFARV